MQALIFIRYKLQQFLISAIQTLQILVKSDYFCDKILTSGFFSKHTQNIAREPEAHHKKGAFETNRLESAADCLKGIQRCGQNNISARLHSRQL